MTAYECLVYALCGLEHKASGKNARRPVPSSAIERRREFEPRDWSTAREREVDPDESLRCEDEEPSRLGREARDGQLGWFGHRKGAFGAKRVDI